MMTFFIRRKRHFICCIILLVTYVSAWAQEGLSLSALTDSAIKFQPLIKQNESYVQGSYAELRGIKHSFLPQVKFSEQLNAGTDNSLAGSYFTLGITPSTSAGVRSENNPNPESGNVAVVYGEYELYNFGLNKARIANAQAGIDLQKAGLERERYLLELRVAGTYFSLLRTQYRLSADEQNVRRYDSIYTIIKALSASGLRPGSDSSLAAAELSRAKVNYNQTRGNVLQLKDELSYLTGILPAKLQLKDSAFTGTDHYLTADTVSAPPSRFPLIDYYYARQNILKSDAQVIRKAYLPKISLVASTWARGSSIQYNDQYKALVNGFGYQRYNYAAGIAFTYNLFNGLFKKDQLVINRFQQQAGEYELQQQTLALSVDLKKADHAIQTARANYLEIPVQLRSAGETYGQKLAQYKAGLISLVDLNNASFVLYRSQIDYSEGLTDLLQARLDKAAASGQLYQFIQTFK